MRRLVIFGLLACSYIAQANAQPYINNKAPLKLKPYMELPLGSIKAKGWLNEMLVRQKNGATVNWISCTHW